ncbi:MAG: eukaryotic-like serine/threonine-protein kinase [Acidobacteriota bacterium]|jgi:serine/threonine protein kinase
MDHPLWDRVQEIYHSTLPMAQSERSSFLASTCGHDPVLVREVSSLLDADDSSDGFLESPVFELGLRIIASNNSNGKKRDNGFQENLAGTTIDERYLVESELGHGGMGKVYLARDLSLHNRRVVIKVLLQASLQDAYVVRKFRQEVEALARIDHPGVVSVLGAGKLPDGKLYIAMQYVSGVTLRSEIPGEGMNLERAALILQQVGAALEDIHEKGIFHRDLKPENIMLQAFKRGTDIVKVVDFGIAKVKDSVIAPSTVNDVPVGTVLYMSPEQLRGGEKITSASDIYSLAVIAYEMVTGRRPFNPTSAPQLLEMHRAGVRIKPIDLRTNVSTEAQAIILHALSFEPAARYQNATEFGDSLARALINEGETAPQKSLDQPRKKLRPVPVSEDRRSLPLSTKWRTVVASSLVILVSLAVGWLIVRNIQDPPLTPRQRVFTYWLTVQKMRDDKPYQDPFQASGQEIFETGYKFRLNVNSAEPGYLYLFNYGPPDTDGTSFTIIYPTPETNGGSAALNPDQPVRTNSNTFKGQPGTENFWIVWSAAPVPELETAKAEAFTQPHGALTGKTLLAVKEFLYLAGTQSKSRTTRDKNSTLSTVRGTGDVIAKLVELQHR